MSAAGVPIGPSYLSSHSADVMLSDIRPIKLREEALNGINVLLDEFLGNVLRAAQSLTKENLRAGLLAVLPTTLGKEALLDAELELKTYWDQAKTRRTVEDDKGRFDLEWSYELLRLKCQAYSTFNEADEDRVAEGLLQEHMADSHPHPPLPALVAPAALYLTTILESICEHILSNVGRVASRDSSRTYANSHDLFVALCEDDAIYGAFKAMKVYAHIEELSKMQKSRRSKSITRNEQLAMSSSRTSSPYQDTQRQSNDAASAATPSGSRSSLDKARSMKKFMPTGRLSSDTSQTSLLRSESTLSEETQQTWAAYNQDDDDASIKEFDDLMRSTSTMKVSLTPDRLRTMEVYRQEKERSDRRGPLSTPEPSSSSLPPRAVARRPSVPHVDSINEDDEQPAKQQQPQRAQHNYHPSTPAALASSPPPATRARSHSHASSSRLLRKLSKSSSTPPSPPVQQPPPPPPSVPAAPMAQTRDQWSRGAPKGFDADPFPTKTRRKQVNRESLDLDAVMAGSDDEAAEEEPPKPNPSTPKRGTKVSANTRDLMSFLEAGPPSSTGPGQYNAPAPVSRSPAPAASNQPKVSKAQRELLDFLNEGPPEYMTPPTSSISFADNEKPKNGGRLQRMMSKLSMGGNGNEKGRQQQQQQASSEDVNRSIRRQPSYPTSILQGSGNGNGNYTNNTYNGSNSKMSSPTSPSPSQNPIIPYALPRPTPPPVPVPISPPASPPNDEPVTLEYSMSSPRSRKTSAVARTPPPKWESPSEYMPAPPAPMPVKVPVREREKEREREPVREGASSTLREGGASTLRENAVASSLRSRPSAIVSPPVQQNTPNPSRINGNGVAEANREAVGVEKPVPVAVAVPVPVTEKEKVQESGNGREKVHNSKRDTVMSTSSSRKVPPPINADAPPLPAAAPAPSFAEAQEMQRLMARATSADECRLIVDMFLARAGVSHPPQTGSHPHPHPHADKVDMDVPYPSPSPSETQHHQNQNQNQETSELALEQMLVEFLLGSEVASHAHGYGLDGLGLGGGVGGWVGGGSGGSSVGGGGPAPLRKKKHSSRKFVKVGGSAPSTPTPTSGGGDFAGMQQKAGVVVEAAA